jgi:hypothetical protein
MPPEIQEAIYDLHVRQDLNPLQTYQKLCQLIKERGNGIKPPAKSAFYNHIKRHLDPERTALMRIAKSQERADTRGGLRGVTISYLLEQFKREQENRKTLQKIIDKIDRTIKDGKAWVTLKDGTSIEVDMSPIDLSSLSKALGYLCKIRSEDQGLTEMVQGKVMEDMIAGIMNQCGRVMVVQMKEGREQVRTIVKGPQKEELVAVLDQIMAKTLEGMEKIYGEAVGEIATLIKSKIKG